jgi:hypothetical protein
MIKVFDKSFKWFSAKPTESGFYFVKGRCYDRFFENAGALIDVNNNIAYFAGDDCGVDLKRLEKRVEFIGPIASKDEYLLLAKLIEGEANEDATSGSVTKNR